MLLTLATVGIKLPIFFNWCDGKFAQIQVEKELSTLISTFSETVTGKLP